MKIPLVPQVIVEPRTQEELLEWIQKILIKVLRNELGQIRQAVGALGLENLNWKLLSNQAFVAANTEYSFTHNLGRVPDTVIPFIRTDLAAVAATVYKGPTAWTTTLVFLKSTAILNADLLIM